MGARAKPGALEEPRSSGHHVVFLKPSRSPRAKHTRAAHAHATRERCRSKKYASLKTMRTEMHTKNIQDVLARLFPQHTLYLQCRNGVVAARHKLIVKLDARARRDAPRQCLARDRGRQGRRHQGMRAQGHDGHKSWSGAPRRPTVSWAATRLLEGGRLAMLNWYIIGSRPVGAMSPRHAASCARWMCCVCRRPTAEEVRIALRPA